MKFFTAVKTATFAEAAFKAAGLDLEAAQAAGNVDAIKSALAAASAARPTSPDVEQTLAAAAQENKDLSAALAAANESLTKAKADADKFAAASAALKDAGIDASDAAKLKEQIDAKVAKEAAAIVAKSGHAPVADDIVADAEAAARKAHERVKRADESGLKGRDRMEADFHRQAAKLNARN